MGEPAAAAAATEPELDPWHAWLNPKPETPLFIASAWGRVREVRKLLAGGVDIEETSGMSRASPAWIAAHVGHVEVLKLLLAAGADVSATDWNAATPLHGAAQNFQESEVEDPAQVELNKAAAAKLLLAAGAEVSAKDNYGRSPLTHASGAGYAGLVLLLLQHGADVSAELPDSGDTPLHHACAGIPNPRVVQLLLAHGADLSAVDTRQRYTPLHNAAGRGIQDGEDAGPHLERMRLLLEGGADPSAKTMEGQTPLHIAAATYHLEPDVVLLLLRHGADPSAKGEYGSSPLHLVAHRGPSLPTHGLQAAFRALLDAGANISAQNNGGWAPEDLARARSHHELVAMLRAEPTRRCPTSY